MTQHRKSFKEVLRQQAQESQLSGRQNPHQATCQGVSYKFWWPKINTSVFVKRHRKPLVVANNPLY